MENSLEELSWRTLLETLGELPWRTRERTHGEPKEKRHKPKRCDSRAWPQTLFIFVLTACIAALAGALYYPQAGIINPAELAPVASIYLAVWVAIGGRGRLYGAIVGAAFVSLLSSYFTGGHAPDLALGLGTLRWTEWWLVLLGLSFVVVTLYAPKGMSGIVDRFVIKGNK